ncbi:MAG: hypothetical protein EP299_13375 [Acidobacteria bacterium]|nr:MAG: hypothetical protein EP299_13375 [Acidobacteriota bacterium]
MRKLHLLTLYGFVAVLVACGGGAERPQPDVPEVAAPPPEAVAARPSQPAASTGGNVSFLLESGYLYAGEKPIVHFDRPVPTAGGRYWITVVESSKPDDKYGAWQYIDAGATEVPLASVRTPGWYEVRLHDRYPELSTHVISRAVLEVVEVPDLAGSSAPEPKSSSRPAAAPVASETDPGFTENPFDRVSFMTESEVLSLVGPPAAKLVEEDRTRWFYEDQYPNDFGEQACPELHFMGGQVMSVVWYPPHVMSDHIETARLHKGVRRTASTGSRPETFTYDEAHDRSVGRSKQEITAAFGEPTSKRWIDGREVWQYDDLIYEQGASMLFAIAFDGDQVLDVQAMR